MQRTVEPNRTDSRTEIVERLLLLERSLQQTSLPLRPFSLERGAPIIAVQKAGARIARYLGLEDLVFLVLIRKQARNVAGRIHLETGGGTVEVELSDELFRFPASVLSTLCHEITHKYLHRRDLVLPDTSANEKLTDTAAVYLGLGAFMLEGCRCQHSVYTGSGTTTTTLSSGYLKAEEFAITIAALECIHPQIGQVDHWISEDAGELLAEGRRIVRKRLPPNVHRQNLEDVLLRVAAAIRAIQNRDISLRKCMELSPRLNDACKADRARIHGELLAHQRKSAHLVGETRHSVIYLEGCRILLRLSRLADYKLSSRFRASMLRPLHRTNLTEISCPACEQRLRVLGSSRTATLRCGRCKYMFLAHA